MSLKINMAAKYLLLYICLMASGTQATRMSYGTGMACSYFEGYLNHILPNNGPEAPGLVENMRMREEELAIYFPVKRFFIILTKSMYCPPDLQVFNKPDKNVPSLETIEPLLTVVRDASGELRRTYRSGAWSLRRPGRADLHVAAECATPLHTFYMASMNEALAPVFVNVNIKEEIADFTTALHTLTNTSQAYKDCEIVYFDDTDSQQNLADVLLDKIREIKPDFEINHLLP